MKIGMQTWGSEGDINPFIALAWALSRAGHDVTLAITSAARKDYETISQSHGFKLGTVEYIGSDEKDLARILRKIDGTSNLLTQMNLIFKEMFEPCVASMYKTAQTLCAQNEILIGHFINHPMQAAAEKSGKPYITVTLNHGAIPTRYQPPIPYPNLGEWINVLLWKFAEKVISLKLLPPINDLRKKVGLKPVKSYRNVWESPLCNLIAISPVLCRPRDDWTSNQKICGFFRPEELADDWPMPDGLMQFLDDGVAPVYMTLGSVIAANNDPTAISDATRLLCDAAKLTDRRAVIQSKWEFVSGVPEDENVFRVDSAPYTRVFPKCAAVVHHGGAGTTQTTARSGCPSVVIAHIPDQILWGTELKRLSIGAKVLNRRTVNPKKIARELKRILDDPTYGGTAKKIGKQLEQQDGVANAVKVIQKLFT